MSQRQPAAVAVSPPLTLPTLPMPRPVPLPYESVVVAEEGRRFSPWVPTSQQPIVVDSSGVSGTHWNLGAEGVVVTDEGRRLSPRVVSTSLEGTTAVHNGYNGYVSAAPNGYVSAAPTGYVGHRQFDRAAGAWVSGAEMSARRMRSRSLPLPHEARETTVVEKVPIQIDVDVEQVREVVEVPVEKHIEVVVEKIVQVRIPHTHGPQTYH